MKSCKKFLKDICYKWKDNKNSRKYGRSFQWKILFLTYTQTYVYTNNKCSFNYCWNCTKSIKKGIVVVAVLVVVISAVIVLKGCVKFQWRKKRIGKSRSRYEMPCIFFFFSCFHPFFSISWPLSLSPCLSSPCCLSLVSIKNNQKESCGKLLYYLSAEYEHPLDEIDDTIHSMEFLQSRKINM